MEQKTKFTPQGRSKLIAGTILMPELAGLRLIVVPCAENGKPDTDLHKLLDKKWPVIARDLKGWYSQHTDFKLGSIHTSCVQSDTWCIHALCFDKDWTLNEQALEACLKRVAVLALSEKASVHFSASIFDMAPTLQDLVVPYLLDKGIHTYFYQDAALVKAATPIEEQPIMVRATTTPVKASKKPVHKKAKHKEKKVAVETLEHLPSSEEDIKSNLE